MFYIFDIFKRCDELKKRVSDLEIELKAVKKVCDDYAGRFYAYTNTLEMMLLEDKITAEQYTEFLRIKDEYWNTWQTR